MRKEKQSADMTIDLTQRNSYHHGHYEGNYAFNGFDCGRYAMVSDRKVQLDENFNRVDGKPNKFFGLEIETECSMITDADVLTNVMKFILQKNFPEGFFKYESDSSLHGSSSVECITLPATKEGIRNMYPAFKAMYDAMPLFGVSCAASGNCGMHVNISNAVFGTTKKTQDEAIRKLYTFINRHFSLACALVSRPEDRTCYCQQMSVTNSTNMPLAGFMSSHGVCFNLGHYSEGRIELRLVGGQRNFECFRNTMEVVFHLCAAMKRVSWDSLDDIAAVFSGCNQAVYERLTRCYRLGHIPSAAMIDIRATVTQEDLI